MRGNRNREEKKSEEIIMESEGERNDHKMQYTSSVLNISKVMQ
jgi:hypothetical protein